LAHQRLREVDFLGRSTPPPTLHDRWGRLTQVWFSTGAPGSSDPPNRAVYRYNGLTMRCLVERDADTTDATHALSERRAIYYGAGWQVLEEHVDTGMEGTYDSLTQNVWGLRYIDELVLRRTNANWNGGTDSDFTDSTDTEWEQYLHDHQFSVVAGVNRVGTLTFRVAYDAYGEARHSWARDIDGDGDVDGDDYNIANAARTKEIEDPGYNADADWNRDGEVTSTDVAAFGSTHHAGAIPAGLVAPRTSELTVGFCGYRFNPEIGAYTVRFRHYDPTPGMARWLERDPAGYVDGPSLYAYLGRSPVDGVDPLGLAERWHHIIPKEERIRDLLRGFVDEDWIHSKENGLMVDEAKHIELHAGPKPKSYNTIAMRHLREAISDLREGDFEHNKRVLKQVQNRIREDFIHLLDGAREADEAWKNRADYERRRTKKMRIRRAGGVIAGAAGFAFTVYEVVVSYQELSEAWEYADLVFQSAEGNACWKALAAARVSGSAIGGALGAAAGAGAGFFGAGIVSAAGSHFGEKIAEAVAWRRYCVRTPGDPIPAPGKNLLPAAGSSDYTATPRCR
jgi:RHS repeat-associated protein